MALTDTAPALLTAALDYAKHNFKVFPCWPIGSPDGKEKAPRISKGFHQATSDAEQIRVWWQRWPTAAIGLPGSSNGLLIVDLDMKDGKNGEADWANLAAPNGWEDLSPGPVSASPSGGWHLFFALPPGVHIKQGVSRLAPGIDTRTDGYAIVPPTPGYTWINRAGLQAMIPLVPEWLLALLPVIPPDDLPHPANGNGHGPASSADAYAPSLGVAEQWLGRMLTQAKSGSRNETGLQLAAQLRDTAHLDFQDAQQYMRRYFLGVPQPQDNPYTWRECLASLQQVYKAERQERPAAAQPKPIPAADLPQPTAPASVESLLKFDADHAGSAHALQALFPQRFLFAPKRGWLYYTGKYWLDEGAEARAFKAAESTLVQRARAAVDLGKPELIKFFKRDIGNLSGVVKTLGFHVDVAMDKFNTDPDVLNVANGVLDLRSGQLLSHAPSQRFLYCLGAPYDPAADSPDWKRFVLQALDGNQELCDWLQMALGYSLTGHTRDRLLFYMYGPTGAGKGTITNAMQALLTHPMSAAVAFNLLTVDRRSSDQNFEFAPLQQCRFLSASESDRNSALNPALLKQLTGRDPISCSFKGKDHFNYEPQFKIWLSSNHPLNVDVEDDAAWERLRLISLPNKHRGDDDDLLLYERLRTPAAQAGLLAWLVEGAKRWYASPHGLPNPAVMRNMLQTQRAELDHVQQWLAEHAEVAGMDALVSADQRWVSSAAAYQSYRAFCDGEGIHAKQHDRFSAAMRAKNLQPKHTRAGSVFVGLLRLR